MWLLSDTSENRLPELKFKPLKIFAIAIRHWRTKRGFQPTDTVENEMTIRFGDRVDGGPSRLP